MIEEGYYRPNSSYPVVFIKSIWIFGYELTFQCCWWGVIQYKPGEFHSDHWPSTELVLLLNAMLINQTTNICKILKPSSIIILLISGVMDFLIVCRFEDKWSKKKKSHMLCMSSSLILWWNIWRETDSG